VEPVDEAGFADRRVADDNELDQMVVAFLGDVGGAAGNADAAQRPTVVVHGSMVATM